MKEVDVQRLAAMRRSGARHTILDVREPWEWERCRLEPAVFVPLSRLPGCWETLPTNHPVVIVCHRGLRSAQAVAWLNERGRDNILNLAGGLDAWACDVDPTMGRY